MQYKIGDVARILGISTDLLRYYEKKGVVAPTKDKQNDYRYYDAWDINFLIDCLWYKNFGFGIAQIAYMVSDCYYGDLLSVLDEKRDEIKASIRHQELLLQRISQHLDDVTSVKEYIGKCDIRTSPEIVCYLNRYNFEFDNRDELQKLSQHWLKYMPFTRRYFEIPQDGLSGEAENYAWGFSLSMPYVEEFGVPVRTPVVHLPSKLSIHSAFKSSGKNAFTARHIDYIVRYAEDNGLKICGNARGNLVCSILEDGENTGYFEVWLPIE